MCCSSEIYLYRFIARFTYNFHLDSLIARFTYNFAKRKKRAVTDRLLQFSGIRSILDNRCWLIFLCPVGGLVVSRDYPLCLGARVIVSCVILAFYMGKVCLAIDMREYCPKFPILKQLVLASDVENVALSSSTDIRASQKTRERIILKKAEGYRVGLKPYIKLSQCHFVMYDA
ncbi:hypothetical protein LOAG_10703 [Loa loa]|uniref:Uncharacterized protein n=1 Tax=Loa loa TaxID=7209 RepID=A0A1S0TPB7_LOALO|nr:hypothetical protein LOAG_10703 [Loa loa]EFO17794.1 hypothetical protein LOAG_10703 [Loa loa]